MKGSKGYHGSPKQTHSIHGGEKAGAGYIPAVGPGKTAKGMGKNMAGMPFEGGTPNKPKGLKISREGE